MGKYHITPERKEYLYQKKEILYRKGHGKIIFGAYLSKIAYMFPLEKHPKLFSLEETDAILKRFHLVSAEICKETKEISAHDLCAELLAIKNSGKSFYVLIDHDWSFCGILKIDKIEILNEAIEFGDKIYDDLIFISDDMSFAVSLNFYEMDGEYYIEVDKWVIRQA